MSAPDVVMEARVFAMNVVDAIAAAAVWGPAAVATPSAASVGGFPAAPSGVESDVVVIVMTGVAVVAPTVPTAVVPVAVVATVVFVVAAIVTAPTALTLAVSERR